jgi:hypothetical protein
MLKIFTILRKATPIKDEWMSKFQEKGIYKNCGNYGLSTEQKEEFIKNTLKRSIVELPGEPKAMPPEPYKPGEGDIDLSDL